MSGEPAVDAVVLPLCPPNFFYDSSVHGCMPCANVCGESGLNKFECRNKCPDFAEYLASSTSPVSLLSLTSFPMKSADIWVTLAAFSILLAALTVSVVMFIIMKSRKRPSDQSNQGLIPQHTEDGFSPDNADTLTQHASLDIPEQLISSNRALIPSLPSKHCSYQDYRSSLSNIVNLSEIETQIPRSQTAIFDEKDGQRTLSPISLKSDLSLAGRATEASTTEVRVFSGSSLNSVCSSIYSFFHMIGWLNKTKWVMEYSEDVNGLRIGVEGITKAVAEDRIRHKGQHLSDFRFVVTTTPTRGRFVPCPYSNQDPTHQPQILSPATLKPGSIIFSDAMEADPVSRKSEPGYATYSGAVSGLYGGIDVGLTVGHLYANEKQTFFVENRLEGGRCRLEGGRCVSKYTSVIHKSLGQVTADLALLQIALPVDNTVTVGGRRYHLSLFKADLSPKLPVIVLFRDGSSSEGIIAESMFTLKRDELFNTLRIIRAEGTPQKIAEEGYSGALVLSKPSPHLGDQLFVYGMVIGYWESDDKDRSHTVATRLWNILETVPNGGHLVEFSCNNGLQMDSGYQSQPV